VNKRVELHVRKYLPPPWFDYALNVLTLLCILKQKKRSTMAVILWLSQGIERLNPICWFPI